MNIPLKSITDAGWSGTYDAHGLLVKKVAGGTTTIYVYDGAALIAEYDGAGTLLRNHLNLSGVPLATLIPAGAQMAITYHASDHLSIRNDTDKDAAVVATQGHLPFGESWYADGTPSAFRFTNYIRDTTSGLDFAPFRAYQPRLGVYTTTDPLGLGVSDGGAPSSLGLYSYVLNDPVNALDPLGLTSIEYMWLGSCLYRLEYESVLVGDEEHGYSEVRRLVQAEAVTCEGGGTEHNRGAGEDRGGVGGTANNGQQRDYEKVNHDCLQDASAASAEDFDAARTIPKGRTIVGGGAVGVIVFIATKGNPLGWVAGAAMALRDNIGGAIVGTAKRIATYSSCMAGKGYVLPHGR